MLGFARLLPIRAIFGHGPANVTRTGGALRLNSLRLLHDMEVALDFSLIYQENQPAVKYLYN